MENNKQYWKGIEEFTNETEFVKNAENEFPEYVAMNEDGEGTNRRDFLKLLGFSVAAVSIAACETPVKKAIPYLNKPVDIDPSIPNYYASTYFDNGDYASILVKTREGRPIKIEGNTLSKITKGKTSARAQASILGLYDDFRYKEFRKEGSKTSAKKVDDEIAQKLRSANNIYIVSPTIISPSTLAVIKDFNKKFGSSVNHIQYDTNSAFGILEANRKSFGKRAVPSYDFSKAKTIVSIGADFLGTWVSPTEFATQYAKTRKLNDGKKDMSRHYQFETGLSLTGANADYRVAIKPSLQGAVVATLYKKLTGSGTSGDKNIDKMLDKAVKDLKASKGKSLVVSGSNDPAVQTIVNGINDELKNYGKTLDLAKASNLYKSQDKAVRSFIKGLGSDDAVIFYGSNPVYTHPDGEALKKKLEGKTTKTSISFATHPDETSKVCEYVCPDNHYLESWNDAEPKEGSFSLAQPAITPIFKTRAAQESFLVWSGKKTKFYDYIRNYWKKDLFSNQSEYSEFEKFWTASLYNGVFELGKTQKVELPQEGEDNENQEEETPRTSGLAFKGVGSALSKVGKGKSGGTELALYEKVAIGSGKDANNPWLQEMPDPISKATWDNYVCVSQSMAKEKKLKQGDIVKVSANGTSVELPVLVQPGQAKDTISIAVGYGKIVSGKVGQGVGKNVYPFAKAGSFLDYNVTSVSIEKTGSGYEIGQTQTHHTIMGRNIIQESTLVEYKKKPNAGRKYPEVVNELGEKVKPGEITLWKGHAYPNHSWGMVVDLNSCIGCGACTIACQVENNIPVVGKKEVLMRREMHWMRIDRYYSNEPDIQEKFENGEIGDTQLEDAAENPEVTFMPMMCQHCNNAPCETVCPVLATTHSTEGLNQMAYNRCIGTRYCANNCPFKVRRFNWFHYAADKRFTEQNYTQTTDLGKMVLNPDVTVRSRGVMEKCSMCVQRIQAGKLEAKKEKRHVKDGEIQVACAQVCPTEAITFGDMRDMESNISKTLDLKKKVIKADPKHGTKKQIEYSINEPRAYTLLEEINVKPQVSYLTKIRNKDKGKKA